MDAAIIVEVLRGLRAAITWFVAQRGGDQESALSVIRTYMEQPSNFRGDVDEIVKYGAAALSFVTSRGIVIQDAVELLDRAESEDRDLTDEEVQAFMGGTGEVRDRVEEKLQSLEGSDGAGGGSSSADENEVERST